jgi:hypothetical protein
MVFPCHRAREAAGHRSHRLLNAHGVRHLGRGGADNRIIGWSPRMNWPTRLGYDISSTLLPVSAAMSVVV